MVEWLRAAGEPTRLRVLALLAREELAVTELVQILGHSQPRVSRHLKLLSEAGLVERFPDGAWVFYRLCGSEPQYSLVLTLLDRLRADDALIGDLGRLEAVRCDRGRDASAYFARNAARWDEIRSLHVPESAVEAAIIQAAGDGPYARLIDLGTGAGRMLTLLGPKANQAIGLDLSQQMLNIARTEVASAGLAKRVELRHGDIMATGLASASADVVVLHWVLHYLGDPGAAVAEAARLLRTDGHLLIVDFAPHTLEYLRQAHQHRRLGFSDEEIGRWIEHAGLSIEASTTLSPDDAEGLTVKVWRSTQPKAGSGRIFSPA